MKRFKLRQLIMDGRVKPGHDGGGGWCAGTPLRSTLSNRCKAYGATPLSRAHLVAAAMSPSRRLKDT
jgi:hypothetical protein